MSVSCFIPSIFHPHCIVSVWALSSLLVHPSHYSPCSHLFFSFTSLSFLLSNPLIFSSPKLVSSVYCASFHCVGLSRPQQPSDNGRCTLPNSGLKEIYRAITQRQLHWRFTTAKSIGLNTPSKSTTWLPSLWCVHVVHMMCWMMMGVW